jgi:hypothetical protein
MVGLLVPSIFFSLFFLAAIWKASEKPSGTRFVVMLIVLAIASLSGALLLAWQAGLTILFGGLLSAIGWGAQGRRAGAAGALAVAVVIVSIIGYVDVRAVAERREELRQAYPLVSISDRLAYEARNQNAAAAKGALAPLVERKLAEAESRGQYATRGRVLERVHGNQRFHFATSGRTLGGLENDLRMLDGRSIELASAPRRSSGGCGSHEVPRPPEAEPQYVPQPSPERTSQADYASTSTMTAPPHEMLGALHESAGGDFLNPERFGLVRNRDQVAGFEPHRFTSMPELGGGMKAVYLDGRPDASGDWSLQRVDLVSLRKPSGPAVYLSENLPKVDELKTADTRLLDDFENRALSRLQTDDDVVIEESGGTIRMLGALRAGTHCTRCHAGSRGELIGAFSYELHHKNRPTQLAEQE